jgi:hypothetical protein
MTILPASKSLFSYKSNSRIAIAISFQRIREPCFASTMARTKQCARKKKTVDPSADPVTAEDDGPAAAIIAPDNAVVRPENIVGLLTTNADIIATYINDLETANATMSRQLRQIVKTESSISKRLNHVELSVEWAKNAATKLENQLEKLKSKQNPRNLVQGIYRPKLLKNEMDGDKVDRITHQMSSNSRQPAEQRIIKQELDNDHDGQTVDTDGRKSKKRKRVQESADEANNDNYFRRRDMVRPLY